MLKFLRWLLYPFSVIYDLITRMRNYLFDHGILKSVSFDKPVICIGNITVGGTGKTPHTEYIAKLLLPDFKVFMISRGYKRSSAGVVIANSNSNAGDIGDEPFQMKSKFQDLSVIVAEKRVEGINESLKLSPPPDIILLDDAFQHRHVNPGLNILLVDYTRPVWKDLTFPAGNMRESWSSYKRADIIIITKCPSTFTDFQRDRILKKFKHFSSENIYFSGFKYGNPYSLVQQNEKISIDHEMSVLLVTGIANPKPLVNYLLQLTPHLTKLEFPDHHQFSNKDVLNISNKFSQLNGDNKILITTEKDAVRLREVNLLSNSIVEKTYIIPVEVQFFFSQETKFNNQIFEYVRNYHFNQ